MKDLSKFLFPEDNSPATHHITAINFLVEGYSMVDYAKLVSKFNGWDMGDSKSRGFVLILMDIAHSLRDGKQPVKITWNAASFLQDLSDKLHNKTFSTFNDYIEISVDMIDGQNDEDQIIEKQLFHFDIKRAFSAKSAFFFGRECGLNEDMKNDVFAPEKSVHKALSWFYIEISVNPPLDNDEFEITFYFHPSPNTPKNIISSFDNYIESICVGWLDRITR